MEKNSVIQDQSQERCGKNQGKGDTLSAKKASVLLSRDKYARCCFGQGWFPYAQVSPPPPLRPRRCGDVREITYV